MQMRCMTTDRKIRHENLRFKKENNLLDFFSGFIILFNDF